MTRHHIGFEPDAQGILCAPYLHLAHTVDAQYGGSQVVVEVVAQEVLVVGAVRAFQCDDTELSGLLFLGGNTDLQHLGRQLPLCLDDAVLHIHRRHVGIGTLLEKHRDARRTIARRRLHVSHALHTIDGLLQRRHHTLLNRFRTCTRIRCPHVDGWRRDVGIFLHRQRSKRNHAQRHDEHADDDRE